MNGVLGPDLDVSPEGGSALGALAYSDDTTDVSAFADAVLPAYRKAGLFAAVEHFPGLGSADQSTADGPATVGLDLPELRKRDLLPFRAAIEDGAPAVVLSHALYPMNDFTAPGSLSKEVVTDLLRGELGYDGVAITDDLAEPAVEIVAPVPRGRCGGAAGRCGHAPDLGARRGPAGRLRRRARARCGAGASRARGWTKRWAASWRRRRSTGCWGSGARPAGLDRRDLDPVVVEDRRVARLGERLRGRGLALRPPS